MRGEKKWALLVTMVLVSSAGNTARAQGVPPDSVVALETTAAESLGTEPVVVSAPADEPERPGLGVRFRRAVGNFGSDAWIVSTSPFRARGKELLLMAAVLGAEGVIYANDQDILDAVLRNRNEPVLKQTIDIGTKIEPVGFMGKTNVIYLASLGAGYALNIRALRTIPTQILESHFIAGGVRNIGKLLVGRQHPRDGNGPYEFKFGDGTSFPSGHTSVAYELATIASMNAKSLPVTIASYSLATAIAVQRVESLNHWPSDVFIAAVYGTMVARTVVKQHEKRERERAQGHVMILPALDEQGDLVGVRVLRTF